jgi:hypothetical protein
LIQAEQSEVFIESWSLGSFDRRFSFISGLIAYVEKRLHEKEKKKTKINGNSFTISSSVYVEQGMKCVNYVLKIIFKEKQVS